MKMSEIKRGMYVRVGLDISLTTKHFDSNETMASMRGQVFKVTDVYTDRLRLDPYHYVWHPGDLLPVKEEDNQDPDKLPPIMFHFDPSLL